MVNIESIVSQFSFSQNTSYFGDNAVTSSQTSVSVDIDNLRGEFKENPVIPISLEAVTGSLDALQDVPMSHVPSTACDPLQLWGSKTAFGVSKTLGETHAATGVAAHATGSATHATSAKVASLAAKAAIVTLGSQIICGVVVVALVCGGAYYLYSSCNSCCATDNPQ